MPLQRHQYCEKPFNTQRALNHHTSASKTCHKEWRKELVRNENPSPKRLKRNLSTTSGLEEESGAGGTAFDIGIVDNFVLLSPPRGATVIEEEIVEENTYLTTKKNHFIEPFPGNAGEGYRKSKT